MESKSSFQDLPRWDQIRIVSYLVLWFKATFIL